ncbi:MAG: helix-turn-helix domain-containing protein [Clostridiales bacterium]|nr:helix-turn-helix domain-containing protein [Clostridiales bacterium]
MIGKALKEHRISRNLSLMDVERATGIRNGSLCRWENEDVIPGINFCITLSQFYGITLDELVGLADSPTPIQKSTLPTKQQESDIGFINEYSDIISDNNFVQIAKLFKAIKPELRALALGYIVGLLQNNGINTKTILGY